jgi:hypothetical protein
MWIRGSSSSRANAMPMPTSAWAPDRNLTNAKFEGYKLSFDDDEDARCIRIPLASSSGSAAALPGRTLRAIPDARLGYKEARSRARWNHLARGKDSQAGWIDSEGGFWIVDLSEVHTDRLSKLQLIK